MRSSILTKQQEWVLTQKTGLLPGTVLLIGTSPEDCAKINLILARHNIPELTWSEEVGVEPGSASPDTAAANVGPHPA
jgi:hypothetical protein